MPNIPPEYLRYGGGVLAIVGALWVVSKLLGGKKEESAHHTRATCKSCGWQGQVSKYARKCPSCNAAI